MGATAEADAQLDVLTELLPNSSTVISLRAVSAVQAGRRADAERALATLTSQFETLAPSPDDLAILSSWLGDSDQAVRWLRKACEERGSAVPFVEVEPLMAKMAHHPRCREVLREFGLVKES